MHGRLLTPYDIYALSQGTGGGLPIPASLRQLLFHNNGTATEFPAYYTDEEFPDHSHLLKDYSSGVGSLREKRLGYCYDFDGVDDTVITGTIAEPTTGSVSISAWIKPDTYGSHANGLGRILQKTTLFSFSLNKDFAGLGTNNLIFNDGSGWAIADNGSIALGVWQHVVVTNNGTTINFYVNGISVGSDTGSHTISSSGAALTIGAATNGASPYFNGKIFDPRIYNDALTADEVTYLYTNGLSGTDPGTANLVAHYPLQEESGTTAYDISGNGNHGTITNAVTSGVGSIHQPDAGVTKSYPNDEGYNAAFTVNDTFITNVSGTSNTLSFKIRTTQSNCILFSESATSVAFLMWDSSTLNSSSNTSYTVSIDGVNLGSVPTRVAVRDAITGGTEHLVEITLLNFGNLAWIAGLYFGGYPHTSYDINPGETQIWDLELNGESIPGPTLIPAATPTLDALGGTLTETGRVPQYGTALGYGWQGDGSTVYVDLGAAFIPATADHSGTLHYYHPTNDTTVRAILSQRTTETSGRLVLVANQVNGTATAGGLELAIFGTPLRVYVASALTAATWHTITWSRVGNLFTLNCLNNETGVTTTSSGTEAVTIEQTNTILLRSEVSPSPLFSNGIVGPVTITTGGVTTSFHPIPGTRDVAKVVSNAEGSVISNAVVNGVLAELYTIGDGSWRLPHIENGAHWASQNLLTYSEDFSNAAWSKIALTVTANATNDSDNALLADKLIESATSALHYLYASLSSIETSLTYFFSIEAKADERNILRVYAAPLGACTIEFDLGGNTSTIVSGTAISSTIEDLGNGWKKCSFLANASATSGQIQLRLGSNSYAGDGSSGLFVSKAQLSQSSTALPYQKTVATAQSASALIPAGPGQANAVNGEAINIPANVAPRGLLTDRTGGVIAPLDYAMGTDTLTDETFNEGVAPAGKRFADDNYSDRYGAAVTDISENAYFEPRGFVASVGTSTSPTSTGTKAVTGIGFQPKVILPFNGRHTTDGNLALDANLTFGIGMASSQASVSVTSDNGVTTSNTGRRHTNADIHSVVEPNGVLREVASLDSLDADGFTLDWSAAIAQNYILNHIALGGADIEVSLTQHQMNATNAPQSFAHGLAGGAPTALMFFGIGQNAAVPGTDTDNKLHYGFWTNDNQTHVALTSRNGLSTSLSRRYLSSSEVVSFFGNPGTIARSMSVSSVDASDINATYIVTSATTELRFFMLAIRGARAQVGTFDCNGSTAALPIACSGITPKLFLPIFLPGGVDNLGTVQNGLAMTIGASDGTSHTSCGITDQNGVTTTNARRYQDSTGLSEYDFDGTLEFDATCSFDGQSVILDPTVNTGTGWGQGGYLILGTEATPEEESLEYALVDRNGDYILNRDGSYIIADPTVRT